MAIGEDLTALLPGVDAPTLLIWGEKDTATPLSDGQLMEKRIPDAGLVVLPGAGHPGAGCFFEIEIKERPACWNWFFIL